MTNNNTINLGKVKVCMKGFLLVGEGYACKKSVVRNLFPLGPKTITIHVIDVKFDEETYINNIDNILFPINEDKVIISTSTNEYIVECIGNDNEQRIVSFEALEILIK